MRVVTNPRNQLRLFSLVLILLVAGWVVAAEKNPQFVQVTIRSILAENKSDEYDPKLKGMEQQLKPLKYRSYRLLKAEDQTVPSQGRRSFEIPGGRSLTVAPQDFQYNRIALKVRLTERDKPVIDTTVAIPNKGNFILGGPPHEGGVLVLSISATAQ